MVALVRFNAASRWADCGECFWKPDKEKAGLNVHIAAFRRFPYIFHVEISSSDDSEIIIFILRTPGQHQSPLYSFKVLKVSFLCIEIITLT